MHIKQHPEDFEVEELPSVEGGTDGVFSFYRLEKRGWSTPDALQIIRRRWKLDARRLSNGGLKDRHAHTVQYISILHGPQRTLTHNGVQVTFLGKLAHPYNSLNVEGNRFGIVVRDMSRDEADAALAALQEVRRDGVPNYFDDQRFGSVAGGGPFMAELLVQGRYEDALKAALAAPYPFDRSEQKREKTLLRQHWGKWATLQELLPVGHARSLVDFLASDPTGFAGAISRLRPDLRGLYLSAFQSHLWNRMLAGWLRANLRPDQLVDIPLRIGSLPMHRLLTAADREALAGLTLPLHSHRIRLEENDPRKPFFDQVLRDEGLEQEQFQLKGLRDMFFSKGERVALCRPTGVEGSRGLDTEHPGRYALKLRFELPRGSYATLVVKRITRVALEVDEGR